MSKLLDYLNTLDKDAQALAAHKSDPKGAMDAFGLSHDDQAAVLSGDKKAIANQAGIKYEELPALDVPQSAVD